MLRWVIGVALLPIAAASFAQEAKIDVRSIASDRFDLVVDVASADEAAGLEQALAARAAALCGTKSHWFGRYDFEATKQLTGDAAPAKPMRFIQQAGCGDPPAPDMPRVARPAFDTTSGDDATVIKATELWLRQRAGGDYAAAFAVISPGMDPANFEEWRSAAAARFAQAGKPRDINIFKITWYESPPGAEPGLYAAADFQNTYDNLAAECGYLIWYKQPASAGFVLMRSEIGTIARKDVASMSATDLSAIAGEMRCPFPVATR